jgi:signal transduction histidine kinase
MSIRLKVILPYLLLTVVVAVIGVYVVTRLVANSLGDRLNNQLLEAGRVAADNLVRIEQGHINTARGVVFYDEIAQAVLDEDREKAYVLAASTLLGEAGAQSLILITPTGRELIHIYVDENGQAVLVDQETGAARQPIVTPYLANRNIDEAPHRALGLNLANNETYYYTSLPLRLGNRFAGVVVVGTSLRNIQFYLKNTLQTDIILYSSSGQAISTTMGTTGADALEQLSISEELYRDILAANDTVFGKNITLDERDYRVAYGRWQLANDLIGVYAIALPSAYVLQAGEESRETYIQLFTTVMLFVVVIGFLVSRMITRPIYSLVTTSQEIASGDLEKRSDIHTKDEIEELSRSFNEMTERLQERTRQLEEINQKLVKIDKTKTDFIQISAHELRTPLTLIMGYSQMLEQDTQKDPELLKLAQGILEGSERMAGIVDSMLDASRIDSKALVLKKTSVELDPIIRKVNRGFMDALYERNLDLTTDGLQELPPITADPELLQKVFYHLVMNAIKYTPDGGSIKVLGKFCNGDGGPQVEVTVADTGIGIDPSSLEVIFEKFSQTGEVLLHSSGKTKFKGGGPGLGLAIARGIVEAHGGRIWAESTGYNEETLPGSKFIVRLPVQKEEETV